MRKGALSNYYHKLILDTFYHFTISMITRGARSARADARLCTSSGINLIVPLSFHLVR